MHPWRQLTGTADFLERLPPAMKLINGDGLLWRIGGRVHLAHLGSSWCVVGRGYVCMVMDVEEGNVITAKLTAEGDRRGVPVEYEERG